MATVLNVGDIWEVKWWSLLGDQLGITSMHFVCTAQTGNSETDTTFRDHLALNTVPPFRACLNINASIRGLSLQRMWPTPKLVPLTDTTQAGVGGTAGDPLPKQVSGIIKKLTSIADRSGRGRMYIPFPSEGDSDPASGRPNNGYIAKLAVFALTIQSPITLGVLPDTAVMSPCIWHRAVPSTMTLITALDEPPYWATQRRRGDYGPQNIAPF